MAKPSHKFLIIGAIAVMLVSNCAFNPPAALNIPEYNLAGDRFIPEPVQTVGLKPSDVFWLADSEIVSVNWQSFILTYSFPDASCDLCSSSQVTFDSDADGWFVQCNSNQRSIYNRPEVRLIELDLPIADVYSIRKKIKYEDVAAMPLSRPKLSCPAAARSILILFLSIAMRSTSFTPSFPSLRWRKQRINWMALPVKRNWRPTSCATACRNRFHLKH